MRSHHQLSLSRSRQTPVSRRPVHVSGQWRAVITHPFCHVCPQDKLSTLTAVVYPQGQSLQTPSLLSQSLSFFLFFFCEVLLHLEPVYIHHLLCASKPVVLYVTQYLSILFYFVSQLSVLFSSVWLSVTINTSFTFCKVKLIIMILFSGGLEGLIY